MKVRCVQLLNSNGKPTASSPWAKIGAIYHVLSIWSEPGQIRLRLIGEESTPAMFELEMFEVVSSKIPESWTISFPRPGCISIGPSAWDRPGFWSDFYDRLPETISCFESERARILDADP